MKKILCTIAGIFLLSASLLAQDAGDPEALVSKDVQAYVKTSDISRFLKTINYALNTFTDQQTRTEMLAGRDDFMNKTGIDLLSEASLRQNGIDTSRAISVAVMPQDNYRDVILVFIPVLNEKEFPLKFNEISKKMGSETSNFKTPLKTKYKGVTIYQVETELFTAGFNGFFLMGSNAEVVQKAIDLGKENADSLMLDSSYKDYLASVKNNYDINIFFSKNFLETMKMQKTNPYGMNNSTGMIPVQYGETDGYYGGESDEYDGDDQADTYTDQGADQASYIDAIDYMSLAIGLDGKKLKMNSMVRVVKGHAQVERLIGFLKTGIMKNSLKMSKADTTILFGFDLSKLDGFCKDGNPECADYNNFKMQIMQATGIDIEKDFIPYFPGVINIMFLDSGAANGVGDAVLYIPMTNAKKTGVVWEKLRKTMQQQYGPQKMYGEEKLDGKKAFWFTDGTQMKYYVAYDARGLYVGNSSAFIKTAFKSATMDRGGKVSNMISDKTFMFINIKKNMMLQQAMIMYSGNPALGNFLSMIGEITLHGEKTDTGVSMDFEMELKGN